MATIEITRQIIRDFVTAQIEKCSPSTANHSVTTLRVFFAFLVREGFLIVNPMDGVEKVRQKRALIKIFTTAQIEMIIATCGRDFLGVRDGTIYCYCSTRACA